MARDGRRCTSGGRPRRSTRFATGSRARSRRRSSRSTSATFRPPSSSTTCPPTTWELEGIRIHAQHVSHPGSTVGYRLELNGRALAFIPDHEPVLGVELESLEPEWISGHALAAGADVLVHDCQFSESEYPDRVGWGHSSVADAVGFARRAEVGDSCSSTTIRTARMTRSMSLVERAGELWDGTGGLASASRRSRACWSRRS